MESIPSGICMFKFSKKKKHTKIVLIYLKLTIKTPEPCLLFQLLIYFLLYSTVIIAEFEEINAGWV